MYTSEEIKRDYNRINNLRNLNGDPKTTSITLNYRNMDKTTMGLLKQKVAHALDNYINGKGKYYTKRNDDVKEYCKLLRKANVTDSIDIDYEKLGDFGDDMRDMIQLVLKDRCVNIYLAMTMNPTL